MASPLAGCWQLYGRENAEVLAEKMNLPAAFRCAMKNVRICEEVHVNGDNVHVVVHVPTYSVPAHSKEINFTFGVEHSQSLPFGKAGKGTATKESDTKWAGKFTTEHGTCSITREIRNEEMWVTIETSTGVKCIRKFERCFENCGGQAPAQCPTKTGASQFQGRWKLYGSDNFDKFMEAAGVPLHWRCLIAQTPICETIHVNGNDVHIKICVPETLVPSHSHEFSFKFGEAHELALPFGMKAQATGTKLSESKWQAKLSCPAGSACGEGVLTRELVGNEMWVTIECAGKKFISKFIKCGPCGSGASCGPCK